MGKAETQSHHKPLTPSSGTHKGGISTPGASHWGVKGLCPILDTPALKTCSWKTSPHNIWFWKPAGQTTQETPSSSKPRAGALTHRCQGPAQKQPFEKCPGFLWKGLRCFDCVGLRVQRPAGKLRGWRPAGAIFCSPSFSYLSFLPLFFLFFLLSVGAIFASPDPRHLAPASRWISTLRCSKTTISPKGEFLHMSTVPVCIPASPGANAGDVRDAGSIPGSGRSPGEGNGTPLQYSCLENPMDQGSLVGYSSWGLKELDSTEAIKHAHPPVCMVFLTSIISLLFSVSLRFFPEVLSCFVWNVFLGCFILLDTVLLSTHQTPQSPLHVLPGWPCVGAESFIVPAALALHCFSISLWVKWYFTFNSSQWLRVCQDQPVPKERTCILRPHRTVIIGDTVLGRVPPQDTPLIADWNASPGFRRKRPVFFVQEFWPKGWVAALTRWYGPTEMLLGEWRPMSAICLSPLSCSSSPISSKKEPVPLSGPWLLQVLLANTSVTWFCWPGGFLLQESYNRNQGERIRKPLPSLGHGQRQQTQKLGLSVGEAYQFIIIAAAWGAGF